MCAARDHAGGDDRFGGSGDNRDHARAIHGFRDALRGGGVHFECLAHARDEGIEAFPVAAENTDVLYGTNREHSRHLRQRLFAGADDGELAGGLGSQPLGSHAGSSSRSHLAERERLNHRFESAVMAVEKN